jgi:translation initiation factor 2 subunit 3
VLVAVEVLPLTDNTIGRVLPQGVLRMGQEIEVRPGIITKDAEGRVKCIPVYSRVVSLFAEQVRVVPSYACPDVGTACPTMSWVHTCCAHLLGQSSSPRYLSSLCNGVPMPGCSAE